MTEVTQILQKGGVVQRQVTGSGDLKNSATVLATINKRKLPAVIQAEPSLVAIELFQYNNGTTSVITTGPTEFNVLKEILDHVSVILQSPLFWCGEVPLLSGKKTLGGS
ncbi:hypothetical protein RB195_009103 [Necator americanus]|uniref:Uncharacterized protein n=1 Tax=Necator americanus TaxID=51031 RepID=A0ABR1CT10_NECAM